MFTSDNGGERFSDNWPFVGQKMDLMEGGIRVPLVARWPRADRGRQARRAVPNHDGLDRDDARGGGRRSRIPTIRSTA